MHILLQGSVAEWSKALVSGTSLFGGVGSNPTAIMVYFWRILEVNYIELRLSVSFLI